MPSADDVVTTLRHPQTNEVIKNDDGSDMTITRYSPYSKEYDAANDRRVEFALNKARNSEDSDITFSEGKELYVDFLVDTIKDWNITYNEDTPKFSKKLAKSILSSPQASFIKEQLEEDENSAKGFTKA